ncbi:hypothetical protein PMm318_A50880 [Pseudomonas moorei]
MFIDDDRLKPYLDAVKKARAVRHALRQILDSHDDTLEKYLRANAEYQRAYRELAELAEACAQGA